MVWVSTTIVFSILLCVSAISKGEQQEITRDPLDEDRGRATRISRDHSSVTVDREEVVTFFNQNWVRFRPHLDGLPFFLAARWAISETVDYQPPVLDRIQHPRPNFACVDEIIRENHLSNSTTPINGWLKDGKNIFPVIRVDSLNGRFHQNLSYYFDAESGRVRHIEPLMQTENSSLQDVLGTVYLDNPNTTPSLADVPIEFLHPDTTHLLGMYAHVETCLDRVDCDETKSLAKLGPSKRFSYSPLFLSDSDALDPFSEVNAYRNITDMRVWLGDRFGWQAEFGGETWIRVLVGQKWDNAGFYAGTTDQPPFIVFGVSDQNYAYDADTAHHEFGHAFNSRLWSHRWMAKDAFGIDVSMNALEEALADNWAFLFSEDPVADAYIVASRNADNQLKCPNDLVGEGHYDAEILTGFSWEAATRIGFEPWSKILFGSLVFMTDYETFESFVEHVLESAEELLNVGESSVLPWHIDAIQETARKRGLLDPKCQSRLVPFKENRRRFMIGYGRTLTQKMNFPAGIQWEIESPRSDLVAQLNLNWIFPSTDESGHPVLPSYRVCVRRDTPVEVDWISDPEPGIDGAVLIADHCFDGSPTQLSYPPLSDGKLSKGDHMYVSVVAETDEPYIALQGDLRFVSDSSGVRSSELTDEGSDLSDWHNDGGCWTTNVAESSTYPSVFSILTLLIWGLGWGPAYGQNT